MLKTASSESVIPLQQGIVTEQDVSLIEVVYRLLCVQPIR